MKIFGILTGDKRYVETNFRLQQRFLSFNPT